MGSKRVGARWLGSLIVAAAIMTACSDSSTAPSTLASKVSSQPSGALGLTDGVAQLGVVKVCKVGNVGGAFVFSGGVGTGAAGQGPVHTLAANHTIAAGTCEIVAEDNGGNGFGSNVTLQETPATLLVSATCAFTSAPPATSPCAPLFSNSGTAAERTFFLNSFHAYVFTYTNNQPTGTLTVCKVAGTGVTVGTNFSFTAAGTAFQVAAGAGPTGTCSNRGSFNTGTVVTVQETVPAGGSVSIVGGTPNNAAGNTVITIATGTNTVTFTNTLPPPPAVCDFITFGRLVTEIDGQKVVVSGNAGGNQPGGGILAEFHIEVNGVDNHVADVAFYGPIASGPLVTSSNPNSRRTGGTAKNGNTVELRLWDGGEPGKDTDKIWFSINGATYGPALIDQGNMQYHSNCRGPGE